METSIKTKVMELIEQRVNRVFERMEGFTACKEIYDSMAGEYPEQMVCFKNLVFWTAALHPEWSEEEILNDILSKMNQQEQ